MQANKSRSSAILRSILLCSIIWICNCINEKAEKSFMFLYNKFQKNIS